MKLLQSGAASTVEASLVYQALRFRGFCCSGSVTLIKKGESKKNVNIFGFSGL